MLETILPVRAFLTARKNTELEDALPDALYQASALSAFLPLDRILKQLSESPGVLGEEFGQVYREIRAGSPVDRALENMAARNHSALLSRAMRVLVAGYRTGADITDALRETADDAVKVRSLFRDRAAALTVEKYTLLLAAGFIVPLVLGTLLSLVGSLDLGSLAEYGFGRGTDAGLLAAAGAGSQAYVAINAVLAAVFIGFQENRPEKAVFYAAFLLPVALLLFNSALSANLLAMM